MKGRFTSFVGALALVGSAVMVVAVPSASAAVVTQTYGCATPAGLLGETVTVSGNASILNGTIHLASVKFTFHNNTGYTLDANSVKYSVPDPNNTSAPYKAGSVRVGSSPTGWTAGHDSTGSFAYYAGSATVNNGSTFTDAPMSAGYKDKGPSGTVTKFQPGDISFNITSPVSGTVSCTPEPPIQTIKSTKE